jgi:hypothetical protein
MKCDNNTDPEGIVCYDVTVFTGIGFSGRIFKHGMNFAFPSEAGSYLSSEQILC